MSTSQLDRYVHEAELVGELPAGFADVLVLRSPFTFARTSHRVAHGLTLEEILADVGLEDWKGALISVDGHAVPPEWWPRVRPRSGHLVVIRAIPRGGGDNNKGFLGIL